MDGASAKFFANVLCIGACALGATSALGQAFPEKPIMLYHAYSASGTSAVT